MLYGLSMTAVTRETLYAQVWEQPMTTVAEQYGVSSNYLARICEELKVPRPNRGYWAKRAAGRRAIKVALPEADPGDDTAWDRGAPQHYWRPPPDPVYVATPVQRRRKKRPTTHPLLVDVKPMFEDSKRSSYHDDGYLKPKRGPLPDIFVSAPVLPRALRLANTLYLQLEDRGHWVRSAAKGFGGRTSPVDIRVETGKRRERDSSHEAGRSWAPGRPTLVFIGGVAIGLTLFEMSEELPAIYDDGAFRRASPQEIRHHQLVNSWKIHSHSLPSERLALFAYSPYAHCSWTTYWREDKPKALTQMQDQIVADLEQAAPEIAERAAQGKREAEERARQYREQERKRQQQELVEAQKKACAQSRDELLAVIEGWATARHVERFLCELDEAVAQADDVTRSAQQQRLDSARELLGATDVLSHFGQWSTPNEVFNRLVRASPWQWRFLDLPEDQDTEGEPTVE